MATTIPTVLALLRGPATINNCKAWDAMPPVPMTAAQRATAITAILGGTITTEADALALIATAASGISQKAVWDILTRHSLRLEPVWTTTVTDWIAERSSLPKSAI